MKKWLICLLAACVPAIVFVPVNVWAQDNNALHQQIDAQVWGPFQAAFQNLDGDALNALYADQVLRVTPEGLDTQGQFKRYNATRFAANKQNGDTIALDFWFDSRHTNADTSYEVGFFRIGITSPKDGLRQFYGQFHIVLKKQRGQWQIVQDWDTDQIAGRAITAADFAQKPAAYFAGQSADD